MLTTHYDRRIDGLYVYPVGEFGPGMVWRTVPFDGEYPGLGFQFADVTREGRILGFEILDAKLRLSSGPRDPSGAPLVIESYDRDRDEYRLVFGDAPVATRLSIRATEFPSGFDVTVLLSEGMAVVAYVIPGASAQLWRPISDDVPSPRTVSRRHHRA